MKPISKNFSSLLLALASLSINSCIDKVPLSESFGFFSNSAAHWYEKEGVAYVFFKLQEAPNRLPDASFEMSYSWTNALGGTETVEHEKIEVENGIHLHTFVACGSSSVCGSYSWKLEGPLTDVNVRLRYSTDSDLVLQAYTAVSNHPIQILADGTEADSGFSAIPYGVFNKENNRFQVRIENNFGNPTHSDLPLYGMKRKFRHFNPRLHSVDLTLKRTQIATNGFIFPILDCEAVAVVSEESMEVTSTISWFTDELDPAQGEIGACYNTEMHDKNGEIQFETMGYGLRNPEIYEDNNLAILTPLKRTVDLDVVIRVCEDDEFAADLIYSEFLEYQKHVLGYKNRDTDVCFSIKDVDTFTNNLTDYLSTILTEAKQASVDTSDYIFVVTFHEKLSNEFYHFHSTVAEVITKLAAVEATSVSPRLIGALVYGSTEEYRPTQLQRKYILWCPQNQIDSFISSEFALSSPNCTTFPPQDIEFLGMNFVAPLGPFPSLEVYQDYVEEFSDRGVAKNPELNIYSVPVSTSTYQEKGDQVTYFESQKLTIGAGEAVKVCFERDNSALLIDLRFRPDTLPGIQSGLDIFQVEKLWRGDTATGEYQIGISWEYPFWAGVSYDSAISGTIVSVIPFEKSNESYDTLGESKWQAQSWNIGDLLMHCQKYCKHPYFDEGGSYQLRNRWRENQNSSCVDAAIPVWNGGGAS